MMFPRIQTFKNKGGDTNQVSDFQWPRVFQSLIWALKILRPLKVLASFDKKRSQWNLIWVPGNPAAEIFSFQIFAIEMAYNCYAGARSWYFYWCFACNDCDIVTAYPSRKAISSLEIFNMKVRFSLMHKDNSKNGSLEWHKASITTLFKGLDDGVDNIVDQASKHIHSIIWSVLNSSISVWTFLTLLEKMSVADPGFTHRVCYDIDGAPTGAVWMTLQMRSHYEPFGNFISIDAMKRQLNSLNWPYIAPVILDKNKTIAVIAKSIICAERHRHMSLFKMLFSKWRQIGQDPRWISWLQIVLWHRPFSIHFQLTTPVIYCGIITTSRRVCGPKNLEYSISARIVHCCPCCWMPTLRKIWWHLGSIETVPCWKTRSCTLHRELSCRQAVLCLLHAQVLFW